MPQNYPTLGGKKLGIYIPFPIIHWLRVTDGGGKGSLIPLQFGLWWSEKALRQRNAFRSSSYVH